MLRAASAAFLALVMVSCSGGLSQVREGEGWTRVFEDGIPDFDLEVAPLAGGDSVQVRLGLIPAALVFRPVEEGYRAWFRYLIRVDQRVVAEESDSLTMRSLEETRSYERVLKALVFGWGESENPRLEVLLTDMNTERTATRAQVQIWESVGQARVGRVLIEADGRPLVGLEYPASAMSFAAAATVVAETAGCAHWRLLSVPTDTLRAPLPFSLSPSLGSAVYRGAMYGNADALHVASLPLAAGSGVATWTLQSGFPLGTYRVEIGWTESCGQAPLPPPSPRAIGPGRSFLVRPNGYPRITHLGSMIDALGYIATEDEVERIKSAGDAMARKGEFDAFWGRIVGDPVAASRVLEQLFSRVEEANRRFSAFKEGWKTDRGMVYIVMGPPLYSEDSVDQLRWYYSYDERNAGRYFIFDRVRGHPDELDMPHYVLKRSMEQEIEWRLAVRRWRSGLAR
ncbi:MAG: GWxTD domain-containing protein [Rhodothermales bacterium]|jgi:GWxTD domain-containing protein